MNFPEFPNQLARFAYGSNVYGTNSESSDYDLIYILSSQPEQEQIIINQFDCHLFSEEQFLSMIQNHEISALECIFLPESLRQGKLFPFELNKSKLRHSISAKISNSWVKAKKKFDIENEPYLAKKSLWHSFRILYFGIQLAKTNTIYNYQEANQLYEEIISNSSVSWQDYNILYKEKFNALNSEFRKVAPKL